MVPSDRQLIRDAIENELYHLDCRITKRKEERKSNIRLRKRRIRLYNLFKKFGGFDVWWNENYN